MEVTLVTRFERKDGTGAPEMRVGRLPAAKIYILDQRLSRKKIDRYLPKERRTWCSEKRVSKVGIQMSLENEFHSRACRIPYILPLISMKLGLIGGQDWESPLAFIPPPPEQSQF